MTETEQERYLSVLDVVTLLGVSDQAVRRWIKAGDLVAYKPGKEWRIKESDLEDFLERHRGEPVVAASMSAPGNEPYDLTAVAPSLLDYGAAELEAELEERAGHYAKALAEGVRPSIEMYRGGLARALAAYARNGSDFEAAVRQMLEALETAEGAPPG